MSLGSRLSNAWAALAGKTPAQLQPATEPPDPGPAKIAPAELLGLMAQYQLITSKHLIRPGSPGYLIAERLKKRIAECAKRHNYPDPFSLEE